MDHYINVSGISVLQNYIDVSDVYFKITMFLVFFNPFFWNVVARLEYHFGLMSRFCGGPRKGCYLLAFMVFSLCHIRSYFFTKTLDDQHVIAVVKNLDWLGWILIVAGQILVISSMYQLGIVGTYCGDYFGILMDHKVTDFPFTVSNNPMYHGSTASFLGYSLISGKLAGFVITLWVHFMYATIERFEEPFTKQIYKAKINKKLKKCGN